MKRNQLAMNAAAVKFVAVMYLAAISPCHSGMVFDSSEIQSEEAILRLYARWISHFNVTSVESDPQQSERLEAFKRTALSIHERPAASLNSLADMPDSEFKSLSSCSSDHPLESESDHNPVALLESAPVPVPASIDWRDEGAVLPVRAQHRCGSCWAFSAADTIASVHYINSWTILEQLSVQQLVDCVQWSCGCKHGKVRSAFEFVIENQGITTEEKYPYEMKDGKCRKKDHFYPMVKIDGYKVVQPRNDERALQRAVALQPVSALIDGSSQEFKNYAGGIFLGPCDKRKGHIVTIVGYKTSDSGTDYWIIKNSWGTGWGEKGYLKLAFGHCQIAYLAIYPTKEWVLAH